MQNHGIKEKQQSHRGKGPINTYLKNKENTLPGKKVLKKRTNYRFREN